MTSVMSASTTAAGTTTGTLAGSTVASTDGGSRRRRCRVRRTPAGLAAAQAKRLSMPERVARAERDIPLQHHSMRKISWPTNSPLSMRCHPNRDSFWGIRSRAADSESAAANVSLISAHEECFEVRQGTDDGMPRECNAMTAALMQRLEELEKREDRVDRAATFEKKLRRRVHQIHKAMQQDKRRREREQREIEERRARAHAMFDPTSAELPSMRGDGSTVHDVHRRVVRIDDDASDSSDGPTSCDGERGGGQDPEAETMAEEQLLTVDTSTSSIMAATAAEMTSLEKCIQSIVAQHETRAGDENGDTNSMDGSAASSADDAASAAADEEQDNEDADQQEEKEELDCTRATRTVKILNRAPRSAKSGRRGTKAVRRARRTRRTRRLRRPTKATSGNTRKTKRTRRVARVGGRARQSTNNTVEGGVLGMRDTGKSAELGTAAPGGVQDGYADGMADADLDIDVDGDVEIVVEYPTGRGQDAQMVESPVNDDGNDDDDNADDAEGSTASREQPRSLLETLRDKRLAEARSGVASLAS